MGIRVVARKRKECQDDNGLIGNLAAAWAIECRFKSASKFQTDLSVLEIIDNLIGNSSDQSCVF